MTLEEEMADVLAALAVAKSESVREMLERQRDKIQKRIDAAAAGAPRRGRPAMTHEQRVQRERERLRAREEAKRLHAEELQREAEERAKTMPRHPGRWRAGELLVSVSDKGTWIAVIGGKLDGPARKLAELPLGEWRYEGEEPRTAALVMTQEERSDVEEHMRLTKAWKQRGDALFATGQKPCANYRCTEVLDYIDPRKFCEYCEKIFG